MPETVRVGALAGSSAHSDGADARRAFTVEPPSGALQARQRVARILQACRR